MENMIKMLAAEAAVPESSFPQTGMQILPIYILTAVGILLLITAWGIKRKGIRSKKIGIAMFIAGIAMTLAAIGIVYNNIVVEQRAVNEMQSAMSVLKEAASTSATEPVTEAPTEGLTQYVDDLFAEEPSEEPELPELPVIEIDGRNYIGYLSIPYYSLELPIAEDCSLATLKTSPGRLYGQPKADTFVIGAHNYSSQFGKVRQIPVGEKIVFTDISGNSYSYKVESVTEVQPDQTEDVYNSGYDLALFTCNYSGARRVVIYSNETV